MYGRQNAFYDYDFEIIHAFISLSWTLSKRPKILGHFGEFSFSVMNDISNTNYRIADLWWYMDRGHSQ